MKLLAVLALVALAPLALANVPTAPPQDETLAVPLTVRGDDEAVYLSVCRGAAPDAATVDGCLTSGLYQESNGEGHLQVRAGQYRDATGRLVSYAADARLLA